MTAGSRQTGADMQMWAQTSVLRLQHPFFRKHGAPQAPSVELTRECGWKQGVSAAKADPSEEHVNGRHLYCGLQRKDGNGAKPATRRLVTSSLAWNGKLMVGAARWDGRSGRCPKPRQGEKAPLRPPAPFPWNLMVRSDGDLSRVRKPAPTPPLTNLRRSEELAMRRERGLLAMGPWWASRWSAESGCLAGRFPARFRRA
jgi:hypothetical protein